MMPSRACWPVWVPRQVGQHARCIASVLAAGFKVTLVTLETRLDAQVICQLADPRPFAGEILGSPVGQDVLPVPLVVIVGDAKRLSPIRAVPGIANTPCAGSLLRR